MTESVRDLTSSSFDELVSKPGTWLVDFWAEWCSSCQALGRVLDDFAGEAGDVQVGKIDVSQHPDLGERFEVKSLPTLIIFRDGVPVSRMFGAKTLRQLRGAIERLDAP